MPPNGGACRRSGSCNGAAWARAAPGNRPRAPPERPVDAASASPMLKGGVPGQAFVSLRATSAGRSVPETPVYASPPHAPVYNSYEHYPNSTTNSLEAVLAVLASRTTLYVTSPDSSYHRGVVHAFHSCDVAVREPVVVHDGPLRIAECERCRAGHAGVQSAPLATYRLFPEPGLLMPMNAPACPVAAHRAPGDPNLSIGQGDGELSIQGSRPAQQALVRAAQRQLTERREQGTVAPRCSGEVRSPRRAVASWAGRGRASSARS